ncbi:PDDEXK nuclease domain-containing protein [Parafilimonas sp.]|uniref:PDDEXK nuclease domain-containing protein n=1 Tax=Parafilimonas sp. TaxID=1969739 RepID=UPI0039E6F50E
MKILNKQYRNWLATLKNNIQQSKLQTALQVNTNMLLLYWYIGTQIEEKTTIEGWGAKIINQLSLDLQKAFPDLQGFSVRSLNYMRKFSVTYPDLLIVQQPAAQIKKTAKKTISKTHTAQKKSSDNQIVQQPAAQFGNKMYNLSNAELVSIPWGHHILLLDKINNEHERVWYIQKTIENNWSRAVLQYQIDTDLYQRQYKTKKTSNFHLTLPKLQSDLANEILKDPYKFDFLQLGEKITERELEQQLTDHIQEFLIELGAGFAFVGRQLKLKIGRKEYFIDLLFYHLRLRSFIVIDLKTQEFELEHTGKMNGYLNAINKQFRHKTDNPSIGIILCSSKDDVEVDFALNNINHPIGVSEYRFIKSLPKQFKDELPSAKQLQDAVKKFLRKKSSKKNNYL